MSGHTPGPWDIDQTVARGRIVFQVGARNGDISVTNVAGYSGCMVGSLRHLHHDEDEANAHLIAAAPDLLEALKEAQAGLRCFVTMAPVASPTKGCDCWGCETHSAALAAIAKAEGR